MGYELIETIEVGSGGAASIEFTSIPQDGVDLVLKLSARSTGGGVRPNIKLTVNDDSTASQKWLRLNGTGSSVATGENDTASYIIPGRISGSSSTANTFNSSSIYFSNYTSSNKKSISVDDVTENNATEAYQTLTAALTADDNPITSIELFLFSDSFDEYSTASLYKITDA